MWCPAKLEGAGHQDLRCKRSQRASAAAGRTELNAVVGFSHHSNYINPATSSFLSLPLFPSHKHIIQSSYTGVQGWQDFPKPSNIAGCSLLTTRSHQRITTVDAREERHEKKLRNGKVKRRKIEPVWGDDGTDRGQKVGKRETVLEDTGRHRDGG